MTRVPICGANRVTVLPGDWHEDQVVLTLEDKTRSLSEVITTTPEHPFHVPGRGVVKAEHLKAGMVVSRWSPSASPLQTVGFRAAEAASGHLLVKAITITRSGLEKWRAYNLTRGDKSLFRVSNIKGKILLYHTAWKQGVFRERFEIPATRILFVTLSTARARHMQELANGVLSGSAPGLFVFTDIDSLSPGSPLWPREFGL